MITRLALCTFLAIRLRNLLLRINDLSYKVVVRLIVALEGGVHPKHRLTRYHNFFVENILAGQSVLDVGCGSGKVIEKIIAKAQNHVTGVDIAPANIQAARLGLKGVSNVELVCIDIWRFSAPKNFDVIVMSNVLEHLKERAKLLKYILDSFNPKYFLIRVPMYERDWLVPYKKELGFEWRLDPTHETEYTEKEMRQELSAAGLVVESISFRWSEMYVKAVPERFVLL